MSTPLQPPPLAGVKILLVDDDPDTREILGQVLEYLGAVVRATHSAIVALQFLKDYRPDVIVTDLAMPSVDGLGLVRTVKTHADETLRRIPIIVATAYYERYELEQIMALGVTDYLRKPVNIEQLCASVLRVTGASGR